MSMCERCAVWLHGRGAPLGLPVALLGAGVPGECCTVRCECNCKENRTIGVEDSVGRANGVLVLRAASAVAKFVICVPGSSSLIDVLRSWLGKEGLPLSGSATKTSPSLFHPTPPAKSTTPESQPAHCSWQSVRRIAAVSAAILRIASMLCRWC
jgi:hypothetical protein